MKYRRTVIWYSHQRFVLAQRNVLGVVALKVMMIITSTLGFPLVTSAVYQSLGDDSDSAQEESPSQDDEASINSIGMKLQLIPAGEFMMGSHDSEDFRSTNEFQHRVVITKSFWIGKYEVTRGEFARFVRDSGYETVAESEADGIGGFGWNRVDERFEWATRFTWRDPGFPQTDDHPVVNVSWNDAIRFCEWLSEKEGKVYRLPTEAEWEYACRAGSTTAFNFGEDANELTENANVLDSSAKEALGENYAELPFEIGSDEHPFTNSVGSFHANEFGLYDMHGNVCEWCSDFYGAEFYRHSRLDDPQGPRRGSLRVLRGGSWYGEAHYCRSASRYSTQPSYGNDFIGFRLVRENE